MDPNLPSAKRERSVRVVAEAPSNLVHQIFVDIDENPVDKIRQKFPEEDESLYTGFIDIEDEAIESAATEDT